MARTRLAQYGVGARPYAGFVAKAESATPSPPAVVFTPGARASFTPGERASFTPGSRATFTPGSLDS